MATVRIVDVTSPVGALVVRPAVTVPAVATVSDAVALMAAENVSALLLDGFGGIVTERDIVRALAADVESDARVSSVATAHPVAVPASTPIVDAAAMMLNAGVRHLVVEACDGAVGVVSLQDVVAVLLQVAEPRLWLSTLRIAVESPAEIWLG